MMGDGIQGVDGQRGEGASRREAVEGEGMEAEWGNTRDNERTKMERWNAPGGNWRIMGRMMNGCIDRARHAGHTRRTASKVAEWSHGGMGGDKRIIKQTPRSRPPFPVPTRSWQGNVAGFAQLTVPKDEKGNSMASRLSAAARIVHVSVIARSCLFFL